MRTFRTGLTVLLTTGLLLGSANTVSAQNEPTTSPVFTWQVVDVLEGGALVLDAADARASGVMSYTEPAVHFDRHDGDPAVGIGLDTARLANDDGVWVGARTHLSIDASMHQALDVWQLTGEGGYAGLELRLVDESGQASDGPRWGIILPRGDA